MSRPRKSSRPPTPRPRRPADHPSWWRWLGWGALGLAGATTLLRRTRRRPAAPRAPSGGGSVPRSRALVLDLPPQAELSWISGPGGSLRIAEVHAGGETPVVFAHGLGGCLEHWAPQLAVLGPALHGVAFDLPGHGASDHDAGGTYTIRSLGETIGAVFAGLGLRRALLVAHGVGGLAALDYAARSPGRVAGILLVDAAGDQSGLPAGDRERFLETLERDPAGELEWTYRQFLTEARSEIADRVLRGVRELPGEAITGILGDASRYAVLDSLDAYPGPVRAVASGRNDLPSSLHRLRPGMPCRFLGEASHWLMLDRPQEVWEELVELLEDVRARRA